MRDAHLRRAYGLTSADVREMRRRQKNRCALCHKKFRRWDRVNVDHCHRTKRNRGLLHWTCNIKLGAVENRQFMRLAKGYLKKWH